MIRIRVALRVKARLKKSVASKTFCRVEYDKPNFLAVRFDFRVGKIFAVRAPSADPRRPLVASVLSTAISLRSSRGDAPLGSTGTGFPVADAPPLRVQQWVCD